MAQRRQAGPTGSDGAADHAAENAQQAKDAAQEKAHDAAGRARSRLRARLDERSTQLGKQVRTNAQDVRAVGAQLPQQGKDKPAQLRDQPAERGERLAGYLEESNADRILNDVEDFGRPAPVGDRARRARVRPRRFPAAEGLEPPALRISTTQPDAPRRVLGRSAQRP